MDLRSAQDILYNGNTVAAVICNGVTVWPSIPKATFDITPYNGAYYNVSWYSGDTLVSGKGGTTHQAFSIPIGCKVVVTNITGKYALSTYSLNGFSALSSTGLISSASISNKVLNKFYSATGIMTGDVEVRWDFNQYGAPFTAEYSASANRYDKSGTASLILTAVTYDWLGENKSSYIVAGASNSRNINSNLSANHYGPWSGKFVQSGDPGWWDGRNLYPGDRISGLVQQSGNFGTVSASASASASALYTAPVAGSSTFTQWVTLSSGYPYQMKNQSVNLNVGIIGYPDWNPLDLSQSHYTVTATGYI